MSKHVRKRSDQDRKRRRGLLAKGMEEQLVASLLWPDDTGFKPSTGDPLLRGSARVTGITAKVVRRRDTITRFQYDKANE